MKWSQDGAHRVMAGKLCGHPVFVRVKLAGAGVPRWLQQATQQEADHPQPGAPSATTADNIAEDYEPGRSQGTEDSEDESPLAPQEVDKAQPGGPSATTAYKIAE
jgi:hypothetical protein